MEDFHEDMRESSYQKGRHNY